ncbi:MAG: response regulator [Spirochaetes bacterium]|nr:response regulator [Spirochaetota bacterium]
MQYIKKILVADDDENIVELIREALTDEGYSIISADNGLLASIKAKEDQPGLIILDLSLPRMDGLNVCKKLKAQDETKDIPILIISAQNKKEIVIELLKLGVKNFLAKPFNVDNLINRVNTLYPENTPSVQLTNLKIKYMPNMDILNIKLAGELAENDTSVLMNDIDNRISQNIHKVILNVIDLQSFGMEQINVLEDIKNHFLGNNIKFKITAGNSRDLRSNLIKSSKLKEDLLMY